ncbi:MAG: glycosyl hydrolase family 28-related protein, partial [Acidobacteria bacterium]|nr:glycosyl hydrolase family 28-related protein [Acidobacteriota bacterium]
MTRLLTSLLRFFRQSSPPANQPLISPEQMREVFRQMLCDQEIRLSLKSIMGEAEPPCVSANDPPASEVAGGDVDGKFGTVAGGPRNYTFSADAATRVPLTVQGFAGQTAALQDWKNSQGNVLATVRHDGNVGIGTTEPAEKLDVAGKIRASGDHPILIDPTSGEIETGKLNRIVFLRAGDGPNPDDDGDAINRKIRDLPDSGGIIMLVPGSGSNPYFKIATTVTTKDDINHKTKHGVKIRGYGGAGLDLAQPLTKLLWTGSGTGPVIDFTPYDDGWVQDLELSHLVIDGSNTAKIGLKLNRVEQSRFINLRIENIVNFPPDPDTDPPEDDGIGMFLCSDVDGKNVQFNYFESCTTRAPRALVLDGTETPGGSNSNMNMFVNLRPHYRGTHKSDVGIWLKHAGDNSFSRVTIFNDNDVHETREGHGVVVEHPYAAIGNYFYHLIPSRGVYVRDSTQPLPYEGRMMIYSHSIGVDEPFPQTDDPTVPPEKHVFWADDYGEMHGMPNLAVGTSYMAQGTVSVTVSSSLVQGTGTRFDLDTKVGDRITIVGTSETRTVVGFPDDEHKDTKLTVDSNFGTAAAGSAMRVTTGRLSATGPADFASLRIGGMEVISDERLLHDVLIPRKYPECAARPLVDILGDFPSVLDWGATGDGVTDDRAAFQKAIDNCAGNLLVPRGTYMLSDYLEVPSNITIIGIGQPCLKLMPYRPFRTNLAPPTEPSFNAVITNADRENGNHHIRLVGLKLDGNGDSQYQTDPGPPPNPARGANLAVVLFNYVSFFEIVDCELTGGVSECFYALGGSIDPYFGTTHGIVSNCHIHDSGQPDVDSLGVHGDRVDGMVVSGCTLQNIGLRAIGFSKGTNVSV